MIRIVLVILFGMHLNLLAQVINDSLPNLMEDYKGVSDSVVIEMAHKYKQLGIEAYKQAEYGKSFSFMEKAAGLFERVGDSVQYGNCTNNLGLVLYKNGEYEASRQYHIQARDIAFRNNNKKGILTAKINLANLFYATDQFREAIEAYQTLSSDQNLTLSDRHFGVCYLNIGICWNALLEHDSAEYYLEKGLEYINIEKESSLGVYALNNYVFSLLSNGKVEEGCFYAKKALHLSSIHKYGREERFANQNMAFAMELRTDYDSAYHYLSKYLVFKDSLFNIERTREVAELNSKYELKQSEEELAYLKRSKVLLEEQEREQFLYRIVLIIALVILMVLLFFLYRTRMNALLKNKEASVNEQIAKSEEVLAADKAFEDKKKALSSSTLQLIQKGDLLDTISDILSEAIENESSIGAKKVWESIHTNIESEISADHSWKDFETHFNQLYPQFLSNVDQFTVGVTSSEIRLMELIVMELRTKEISRMLNLSPDSVTRKKNRLRKKLGLSIDDEIVKLVTKKS